jgi:Xaa-Pro aminopeptidase
MTDQARLRRDEVALKLDRLRGLLERRGQAAALRARRNVAWLTAGADTHVVRAAEDGVVTLLVTQRDVVALTAVNEAGRIRDEEMAGLGIEVVELPWQDPAALEAAIAARAGGPVADDRSLEPELRAIRSHLQPAEQDRLAAVGADTARVMTTLFRTVRPGEREATVAARLAEMLAEEGVVAPVLLAASDERIVRYRHPIPKSKRIDRSLMLVVVGERGGLHAALTRIAWLRGRPDDETLRRYEASCRVDAALRDATVPDRTLAQVLEAGIRAYAEVGFPDEWRLHHQGGTIAYQARETIATPASAETVEVGMAFAWNPSVAGTKAEETFVLRPDGRREIVTRDPAWPAGEDGTPSIWVAEG